MAESRPLEYTTELEGIRAPLGVILYLIRRDNLDIYDIPIARITREYLDYVNMMEEMQIELAGEFFVLAATLMRIKAQMLLRRGDEAEEDPREGLVRSLLEYKAMVEAAKGLRDMEEQRSLVFTRPVPEIEKKFREDPEIDVSLYLLMKAFREVMIQFEAEEVREIELEEFTIEERVAAIEERMHDRQQILFTDAFEGAASRLELIVTLMALLELIKHGHVKARQESTYGPIWIYRGEAFGRPLEQVSDWESEAPEPVDMAAPLESVKRPVENGDAHEALKEVSAEDDEQARP